jgi:hypothetical protein
MFHLVEGARKYLIRKMAFDALISRESVNGNLAPTTFNAAI